MTEEKWVVTWSHLQNKFGGFAKERDHAKMLRLDVGDVESSICMNNGGISTNKLELR
jgi:hypothetical protein